MTMIPAGCGFIVQGCDQDLREGGKLRIIQTSELEEYALKVSESFVEKEATL